MARKKRQKSTTIRIGAREYARANRSYGLTTLTRRHTRVSGDRLQQVSKGEESPVCTEENEACFSRNRRGACE